MTTRPLAALIALATLAACGHADGLVPTAAPAASSFVRTPATQVQPLAGPIAGTAATITGRVVHLVGPLSAASVANRVPAPSDRPQAGNGVAGATVYLVDAGLQGVVSPGVPRTHYAVTHTDGSGRFRFSVPSTLAGKPQLGVIAIAGKAIGKSGLTTKHLTIARAIVWMLNPNPQLGFGLPPPLTLYVDTVTSDEASALADLNTARFHSGSPTFFGDTTAQITARYVAGFVAAHHCSIPSRDIPSLWENSGASFGEMANPVTITFANSSSWQALLSTAVGHATGVIFGLHAIYSGHPCPGGHGSPMDYFSVAQFSSNAP